LDVAGPGTAERCEARLGKDFFSPCSKGAQAMRTMKCAELVLDFDLYPRNNLDGHNIRAIADARKAGVELPPVIADKKSKRVVDGFHRVKERLQTGGPDAEIEVIEKTYRNEKEMFLDAMRYNAAHGARLDPCDRTRCTIIADRLRIPLDSVAGALNMPVDKLAGLKADRTARGNGQGLTVALKHTIRHMAGKKLTKRQREANDRSSGMNQAFYVNQIIDLIEADLLDKADEKLLERLRKLHGLLEELLAAV